MDSVDIDTDILLHVKLSIYDRYLLRFTLLVSRSRPNEPRER